MGKFIILLLALISFNNLLNAQDLFDKYKIDYDRLRKQEKHDSALVVAKQMNSWALKNETDTSLRYAVSLRYVGNCFNYFKKGDSALFYWNKALSILNKQKRFDCIDAAHCLNNLGILYKTMGDYKAAEPYFKQALEIRKKVLGETHPDYASSLNNLGILYKTMGDYKAAEPYYKQALEIYKKALGETNPDYASSLNSLGNLYSDMGDYKAAEPYYKQALEIRKKTLGEDHPRYATSLNNLGILYSNMGDYKAAEPYFKNCFKVKKLQLNQNFSWLSSQQKKLFWDLEKVFYSKITRYSAASFDSFPSTTDLSYNANLISKSLLLETSRELDQAIAESKNDTLKNQFAQMKQLRRTYSKMQSEGFGKKELTERLKAQADSLDKILVNSLGEYAASKHKFEITWNDVQSNLTSTDAAIEFARYFDNKDSLYKYMALVVRPGYEYPKLVKLGKENEIKTHIINKDFPELYPLIWKGIDSLLTGVKTVYYSPSGELNNLSFSALCYDTNDSLLIVNNSSSNRSIIIESTENKKQACNAYLIDKYQLHQLTTTRYLADGSLKKEKALTPSIALLGGINYDEIPEKNSIADSEQSNEDFILALNLEKEHNEKRSSLNKGSMPYLAGTKTEVTNISDLLTKNNWKVQTRNDKKAEEFAFKKDLDHHSTGVLHIATHGFAFPDKAKLKTNELEIETFNKSNYHASEDPMVRCGLMLSGSNISWTGNPQTMIDKTGEDGILTAAEMANLDLTKTKLVVLSACETGLGKIEGSEGTFGLKRGFKLAGVEQMIVSLWSVPDKETMELMTLFYTDLSKTLNPVISFEKAQKKMRAKYPTDPEKWAGFVLVR
jgi:CHAT domain-containing protein/Flp pilus assembly protein TadD